jgi:tetratricopeptide (TPR) repeat protein
VSILETNNIEPLTDEEVHEILLHQNGPLMFSYRQDEDSSDKRKAKAYHYLGVCALEKEEFAKARDLISVAISLSPKVARFHNSLGDIFLAEGDVKTSKKYYQEAIVYNESFSDVWTNLANLNFSAGHYKDALNNYQRSLEIDATQSDAWYHSGLIWEIAGNYREAEFCFRTAELYPPQAEELGFHLANVLQKQHRSQEALFKYNQCLNRNPDDIKALFNVGTAYLSLSDFEKAHEFYEKVLKLDPDYIVAVHRNTGLAYHLQKHYFQAIEEFQTALKKDPGVANLHLHLGEVLFDLKDYSAAVHKFRMALKIDPTLSQAYLNLGNIFKIKGETVEALELFQKAIETNPLSAKAYYDQAVLMKEQNQHVDSIVSFRESLRLAFDYLKARVQYGTVFLEQGRIDEAIEQFELVLEQQSNHEEARQYLSHACLLRESFTRGWSCFFYSKEESHLPTKHDKLPVWNGEPLDQKTIYINDTVQLEHQILFSTCLPELIESCKKCIIEVKKEWKSIYERSFPIAQIVVFEDRLDLDYDLIDYQLDLADLPKHVRNEASDFPVQWRILEPDPQLNKQYISQGRKLGEGMKIGVSILQENGINLEFQQEWFEIIKDKNACFIDLHQGKEKIDFDQLCSDHQFEMRSFTDEEAGSIEQPLAQVASCDLVLTCNNLTAHLAGSLGIPVWLILPYQSEWYWFINRDHSLWYNSMRIFRQSYLSNWSDIYSKINRELERTINIWTDSAE